MIPFTTMNGEPQRFRTSEPFGRLIHRENDGDDAVLTGSGVGDTTRLRLFFNLPDNFVFRLMNARLTIYTPETNFAQAYSECYLIPRPDTPGLKTLINFPLSKSISAVSVAGTASSNTFTMGTSGGAVSSGMGLSPADVGPYAGLPLFYGGGGAASGLVWNISGVDTDVAAGTFSYYVEWLMYNVEQAEHSVLYWPVPVT